MSSALDTKFGVYNREQRFEQTLNTVRSIKEQLPLSSDIILLDGGQSLPTIDEYEKLREYCIIIASFHEDPNFIHIQKSDNWDIVKNACELMMYGMFFEKMASDKDDWQKKYKRVFKLSGRYELTENFDLEQHMNADGKIVIRGPFTSQFPPHLTGNVTLQYMSRLWSFDTSLIDYVSILYKDMFMSFKERIENQGYIDIEHLLFKHLDHSILEIANRIGVKGNLAPNGKEVND